MHQVLLEGGPRDGDVIATESPAIVVAYLKPVKWPVPPQRPARPSWWRHPVAWVRWWRWKPPPPELPPMPEAEQLYYRDTGRTSSGTRVYAIDGSWAWYKIPVEPGAGNLISALSAAYGSVHPVIRQDPRTRWVMDPDWYVQVRQAAHLNSRFYDPGGDDPARGQPDPDDTLLGVPVSVERDAGAPYLENRRYPAGWPD